MTAHNTEVGHGHHDAQWFDRKMRGQVRKWFCQRCGAPHAFWWIIDDGPVYVTCEEHRDDGPLDPPQFDRGTGEPV